MATWAKGIDFKNSGNTTRIGGVGIYGSDTSPSKIYLGLGTEPWNNSGLEITSSNINFKGNKVYHAGDKPTPADIGAATSSHTHSYLPLSGGTITNTSFGPLIIKRSGSTNAASIQFVNDNGTLGSVGMSGGANTGLIRWNTDTSVSYTILDTGNYKTYVTPANIGAAASSHSHSYLPLSGGSLTGKINNSYTTNTYLAGNQGNSLINSTAAAGSYTMLFRYPSTNGYFTTGGYQGTYLLQYTAKTTVDAGTNSVTKSVTLLNESGNTSFPGTVTAASFSGAVSGNASTATTLQTARTLTIGSTGKSFNGSANVSWSLAEIGAAASSHNHGLLHDSLALTLANTTTDSGWSMINGSYSGFLLKSIRTQASTPNWIVNNYGAGIAFGGADTKGVLSAAYNTPLVKFAGGNGTAPVWWIGLSGSSGNVYDLNSFSKTNHTHSYLPLSGGTISGRTIINNNASATAFNNAQLEVTASSSGDARITLHSPGRMYASLCAIGSDIIQIETERSGYIRHKNANGYLEIGPKNTSHCHYTTDRSNHWFNADVRVQGHIYAGKAYNTRIAYADPIWRWNGIINANVTQAVTHGLDIANPLISLTTSLGNVNPTIAITNSNQVSIYQYGNSYYGYSNQCNYNICIY